MRPMWMKLTIILKMSDVETDKFTNIFSSFNIHFSGIADLNNIMKQYNLTDIYKLLYSKK